jgi:hypothetical protein
LRRGGTALVAILGVVSLIAFAAVLTRVAQGALEGPTASARPFALHCHQPRKARDSITLPRIAPVTTPAVAKTIPGHSARMSSPRLRGPGEPRIDRPCSRADDEQV